MPPDFKAATWASRTAVGGKWQWVNESGEAAIRIVEATASAATLREIDATLDDGDLATGSFREVATNVLQFALQ
jgi:hypothetical protein